MFYAHRLMFELSIVDSDRIRELVRSNQNFSSVWPTILTLYVALFLIRTHALTFKLQMAAVHDSPSRGGVALSAEDGF